MSTQTVGNARFNARLRAVQGCTPQLAADAQRTHAALLAAARHVSAPQASLADLSTAWSALADVPGATQVLSTLAPRPYLVAQNLEAQAWLSRPTGLEQASAAPDRLRQALLDAASDLGRWQRGAIADIVVTAARALGYSLARHDGTATTGIEAWRGHELILIGIDDHATVLVDHAGLTDGACHDRWRALEGEMAHCGVDLADARHLPHGQERGGQLIAAAAGRDGASLARGLVISQEHGAADADIPGSLFATGSTNGHTPRRSVGGAA